MLPYNYVYSPNNTSPEIRDNGGREIYPAGYGVPTVRNYTIADMGDSISLYRQVNGWDLALVCKFFSTDEFLQFCLEHGHVEGGQTAFI